MVTYIFLACMTFFQMNALDRYGTAQKATAYNNDKMSSANSYQRHVLKTLNGIIDRNASSRYQSSTYDNCGNDEATHLRHALKVAEYEYHPSFGKEKTYFVREYMDGLSRDIARLDREKADKEQRLRWARWDSEWAQQETPEERAEREQQALADWEWRVAEQRRYAAREETRQHRQKACDEIQNNRDGLPMKNAIVAGKLEDVKILLDVRANCNAVCDRNTMLQWATIQQRLDMVDALIVGRADVNARAFATKSCLALACRLGNAEITARLLKAGVRYYTGYSDKTPLRELIEGISPETETKHLACLQLLLTHKKNDPHFLFPTSLPFRSACHTKSCTRSRCIFHRVVGASDYGLMTESQKKVQEALQKMRQENS